MSRIACVVVPEAPHHITQRGNRRLQTFFCDEDYEAYTNLMSQWCSRWGIEVWVYCLMPNHVHLIIVPPSEKALSHAIDEAQRLGTDSFSSRLENVLGRILHKQKPGPKGSQKKNNNF